jgi:hypothetical protein
MLAILRMYRVQPSCDLWYPATIVDEILGGGQVEYDALDER